MVDVISTLTTITLNISDHRLKEETVRVDQKKKNPTIYSYNKKLLICKGMGKGTFTK